MLERKKIMYSINKILQPELVSYCQIFNIFKDIFTYFNYNFSQISLFLKDKYSLKSDYFTFISQIKIKIFIYKDNYYLIIQN